jgi:hypothetical protein
MHVTAFETNNFRGPEAMPEADEDHQPIALALFLRFGQDRFQLVPSEALNSHGNQKQSKKETELHFVSSA